MDPETANKMMNVLTAFPSFRKKNEEKLPAQVRLKRKHLLRTKKWYKEAKENLKNPTYHGIQRTFSKTSKIFNAKNMFSDDKTKKEEEDDDDDETAVASDSSDSDWSDYDSEPDDDDFFGMFGGIKDQFSEAVPRMMTDFIADANPLMAKMMSKSMMYPQHKAARDKLEEWLEKVKDSLPEGDLGVRLEQLELLRQMVSLWEEEKEDDDEEVKMERKEIILELTQKFEKKGKLPLEVEAAVNEEIASGKIMMNHDDLTNMFGTFFDFGQNMAGNLMTGGQGSAVPGKGASVQQPPLLGDCTIL